MKNEKQKTMPFGADFDEEHIWCQVLNRRSGTGLQPALFLDRDGVVVEEVHYLHRASDVQLVPGAAETILQANTLGVLVVIVTNQAGIGYGKYSWDDFASVQEKILEELDQAGAFVNAVYACPFHERGRPPYDFPNHPSRKPNPGMLLKAADRLAIDLSGSWIIGDRAGDLKAGRGAGLSGGLHVETGHGQELHEQTSARQLQNPEYAVYSAASIREAADYLPILQKVSDREHQVCS